MSKDAILDRLQPGLFWLQSLRNRVVKGVTLGVRGLVTDADGAVLLVRHSYISGWYLPGGAVEPGETALQSLARELEEEASVAIEGDAPLLGFYFHEKHQRRDHVVLYRVPKVRRIRDFKPNAEILEAAFFPLGALPDGATDSTRRRLDEHLAGSPVSAIW
ncbi:MAG TPA: NUDIX domain-containing protein [Methylomirabilota bacterium]|nr:NUDIX domain-containing protein [Methylomirabilota bacterium]